MATRETSLSTKATKEHEGVLGLPSWTLVPSWLMISNRLEWQLGISHARQLYL
jgi:hypothetical protein